MKVEFNGAFIVGAPQKIRGSRKSVDCRIFFDWRNRTSAVASAVVLLLACATAKSQAETAAVAEQSESTSTTLGEIIVTAQKREQKLSDVGISIVAASGAQLQDAGVTNITELTKLTPGFSVGVGYAGYPILSLRGVNFNASQISAPPAVSAYIDEAILPYPAMTGGLLLDVERVEVLKGPQGTLFGQNATGGSINVIAAKPTKEFAAGVNAEVNNFGQTMLEGYVSGPLTETLRARFAADTTQGGAWQKGYYLEHDKNGDQNKSAGRLLLDWTPVESLRVALNLNANYDHGQLQQGQLDAVVPINPAFVAPGLIGYPLPSRARDVEIDPGLNTHADNRMYESVLRVDYDLMDSLTVTSLTNYIDYASMALHNLDGTALRVLNNLITGNVNSFNQELRLTGKAMDSRLNYIVGGNYSKDRIDDFNDQLFLAYSGLPVPGAELDNRFKNTSKASGVFANVDYEVLPRLTLTAGARYTSTEQTQQGCTQGNALAAGLFGFKAGCVTVIDLATFTPGSVNLDQKEHNVSWRAGLNFKPTDDSLVYGLVSRGFKAGVFPVQTDILAQQTKPVTQEQLTSYELGTKLAFLDRAVLFDAAVFYYDYLDKQFFTYTPLPLVVSGADIVNVPKSKVKGADLDFVVTPFSGLTLRAAVTYIKTEVGEFQTYSFGAQVPHSITGSEFNFSPPWSGTFSADYRFPAISGVTPYVGTSALFNSRTYSDLGESPSTRIPGYTIWDARAGVELSHWRVGLFARNLTNKYYWTSIVPSGDTDQRFAGLPLTYGLNFGYKF